MLTEGYLEVNKNGSFLVVDSDRRYRILLFDKQKVSNSVSGAKLQGQLREYTEASLNQLGWDYQGTVETGSLRLCQ